MGVAVVKWSYILKPMNKSSNAKEELLKRVGGGGMSAV